MKTQPLTSHFPDYDATLQHTKLDYDSSPDSLVLTQPNGITLPAPLLARVSELLTVEEVDRVLSTWNACRHVTSETLAPGILMDLLQLLPDIAWYLETCAESERKDFDTPASTLLDRLQQFL